MRESKYKVIKGESGIKYICTTCGVVHEGPFAKMDAINCFQSHIDQFPAVRPGQPEEFDIEAWHKKYGLTWNPPLTNHLPNPHYAKDREIPDGYRRPDKNGRWRLGRNAEEKRLIAYFQALKKLNKEYEKYSVEAFIRNDFERDKSYPKWARKRSPLQNLAWAFYNRNWEMVKHAAYQLAYDTLIRRKVDAYLSHITEVSKTISGFLEEIENQAFKDGELSKLIIEPDDLNLN